MPPRAHASLGFCLLLMLVGAASLRGGEPEVLALQTQDGSRLAVTALEPSGLKFSAGMERATHPWKDVKRLRLATRSDPRRLARARQALKELGDDNFEVRRKALQTLDELGRAAIPALYEAQDTDDAEVASRAKQLMAKLGAGEADDPLDRLELADGRTLRGKAEFEAFMAGTAWGTVRFPPEALAELAQAPAGAAPPRVPDGAPIMARAPAPRSEKELAQRLDFGAQDDPLGIGPNGVAGLHRLNLGGARLAGFDQLPDGKTEIKLGAEVEDAYAEWGLLLRAEDERQKVVANKDEDFAGVTRGHAAAVDAPPGAGNLELRFVRPGSYEPKTRDGRPGGVFMVACALGPAKPESIGMEAFDRHGRLLLRVFNKQDGNMVAGGALSNEVLGISARVPIHRVRLFRADPAGEQALRIDDLLIGHVLPAERDERFGEARLSDGQCLTGLALNSERAETLALRPAFLDDAAPPWAIPFDLLERFEPPQAAAAETPPEERVARLNEVLFQSGEQFKASLLKLAEGRADLGLAGGVQITVPAKLLRKVDLWPEAPAEGAKAAPLAVGKDEKPGVEYRSQMHESDAHSPQVEKDPNQPKDPSVHPTEGLPRMDDAEILALDAKENTLTVDPKDGAGAWTIDLSSARYLVWPPSQDAPAHNAPRAWTLVLRQGTAFDLNLKAVHEGEIEAELLGSTVKLPFRVVEALERKRP
ncbi:MAG: hypothetical protein M5U26_28345 [Planctomycetota bacterium]|nr:hypothetical protein [Planctomycetota bacterium]